MTYTSLQYGIFVLFTLFLYYIFPKKARFLVLLAGSICFYYFATKDLVMMALFGGSILISYIGGLVLYTLRDREKGLRILVLWGFLLAGGVPLFWYKADAFLNGYLTDLTGFSFVIPLGLSYYTLQMIAYLADIYYGKIQPQKGLLKYLLFMSFFPQILQGPIPRYKELMPQLLQGNKLSYLNITRGFQLIIWGFFLKYMIADKAGIVVDALYDSFPLYGGCYMLVAAVLYSIQLYADFSACTILSLGVAELFGIHLQDNFAHPYFATSIQNFWKRWHISLSSWLRDYIYIPLGGNRHGVIRKYLNMVITFAISGIWHGGGIKFLVWGLLHGVYQILGALTYGVREAIYRFIRVEKGSATYRLLKMFGTFLLVTIGWVIFRAESLEQGLQVLQSIATIHNPWIFTGEYLLNFGLEWKDMVVLLLSCMTLLGVSIAQEHMKLREWFATQHLILRWTIYFVAIFAIILLGTYGYGYDAAAFLYGEF